jgi:hypothetical protein
LASDRITAELEQLRAHYPDLEFVSQGLWVRILSLALPNGWDRERIDVAFQFPPNGYPQIPFYGFYVPTGLRFRGVLPQNFVDIAPAQPPFSGRWAFFSGNPEPWTPALQIDGGSNARSWIHSIHQRLQQGVGDG